MHHSLRRSIQHSLEAHSPGQRQEETWLLCELEKFCVAGEWGVESRAAWVCLWGEEELTPRFVKQKAHELSREAHHILKAW